MLATDLAKFVLGCFYFTQEVTFCSVMHRILNNHPGCDAYLNVIVSYQSRVHDNNSLVTRPPELGMLLVYKVLVNRGLAIAVFTLAT